MAVYDFKCENCGAEFEVERPLGATGAAKCPKCGSTKTAKVFSAAGIVFKGSGFYVTDSKSKPSGGGDSKPAETKPVETKPAEAAKPEQPATPSKKDAG